MCLRYCKNNCTGDLCVLTTTFVWLILMNKTRAAMNTTEVGHCHFKALPAASVLLLKKSLMTPPTIRIKATTTQLCS